MDINRKLKTNAPEVLKDYRRLLKKLNSSFATGKEIVYIRDNPSESYRKRTGFGDAHRVVMRDRTDSPLGKEVVYHQSPTETTYDTVLAFKEEYIPEGGMGGRKGSKFEPSKDRDVRGGQWDGDDYTMSKKDYAKLHKDFKSKIKGKPYATTMDPKTGATILTPVIITEKRGAEDPYTVQYWYDKQGRKMWATLSGEADAKKFLKDVKGLGMGGKIIKGDVREEVDSSPKVQSVSEHLSLMEKTKQAKFAPQGNRSAQATDPYTVKYSYTRRGRIMVAVLASKEDAEMFLKNVKGLGMNGIIVKGAHYVKEDMEVVDEMEFNPAYKGKKTDKDAVKADLTRRMIKMGKKTADKKDAKKKGQQESFVSEVDIRKLGKQVAGLVKGGLKLKDAMCNIDTSSIVKGGKVDQAELMKAILKAAQKESVEEKKMIKVKLNPKKKIGYTITSPGPDGKPGKVLKRKDVPGKKNVGEEYIDGDRPSTEFIKELFKKKGKLSPTQQKKATSKENRIEEIKKSIALVQKRQYEIQKIMSPTDQGGQGVMFGMYAKELRKEYKELNVKNKTLRKEFKQAKRELKDIKRGN